MLVHFTDWAIFKGIQTAGKTQLGGVHLQAGTTRDYTAERTPGLMSLENRLTVVCAAHNTKLGPSLVPGAARRKRLRQTSGGRHLLCTRIRKLHQFI